MMTVDFTKASFRLWLAITNEDSGWVYDRTHAPSFVTLEKVLFKYFMQLNSPDTPENFASRQPIADIIMEDALLFGRAAELHFLRYFSYDIPIRTDATLHYAYMSLQFLSILCHEFSEIGDSSRYTKVIPRVVDLLENLTNQSPSPIVAWRQTMQIGACCNQITTYMNGPNSIGSIQLTIQHGLLVQLAKLKPWSTYVPESDDANGDRPVVKKITGEIRELLEDNILPSLIHTSVAKAVVQGV